MRLLEASSRRVGAGAARRLTSLSKATLGAEVSVATLAAVAKRWKILLPGLAAALAATALGCAGGGGSSSTGEYETSVVDARDRVDSALANLPLAESEEDFIDRLDQAGTIIEDAAGELNDTDTPAKFEDENERLVSNLRQLSASLSGTADQARDLGYDKLLAGASGLNFESWDRVNAILRTLRQQGVEVQPLARH
jgi:hypothetical protein